MDADTLTEFFELDRQRLRSVAFQVVGSLSDADDVVQSAWLKASRADHSDIRNPSGWFTTITVREALDLLRARRRRSEDLTGFDDGAGVPVAAAADADALLADSVSSALAVVLDRLSPAQRVAFVLHDVFGLPFDQIGDMLDRSAVASKKLASRARERLTATPPDVAPPDPDHVRIVEAFLAASRGGDIPTLLNLLAPDVVRTVDPTLVPRDVAPTIRGARHVAEETRRFTARSRIGVVVLIDGRPGIAFAPSGRLRTLLLFEIGDDGLIHTIDIIGDRDRLDAAQLSLVDLPER